MILGISADFHDSAAAVIIHGKVVAAAEEERFSRVKHDAALPANAVAWCLEFAGVEPGELGHVAFYEKPLTAYERTLVTAARQGPKSFPALSQSIARWSRSRLWIATRIDKVLKCLGHPRTPVSYCEHHLSHAAAAFYPSPYDSAAILTFDGVGEWVTTSVSRGSGADIETLREIRYPDSLGLLYSTMTTHCGFPVNDGEQKLMALAAFGEPTYRSALREVVHVARDGSYRLNMDYFEFSSGDRMGSKKLYDLLDGPPRKAGESLGKREADIARSIQDLLEEALLSIAVSARELTGESRGCLAGGVALNCVATGRLVDDGPFDDVWVQPAAGDSGSAIGAALWTWHQQLDRPRERSHGLDSMSGSLLGPCYSISEVRRFLADNEITYRDPADEDTTIEHMVAQLLASGSVVGWFCGRMEFGPRALGHRSILADPRSSTVAGRINRHIKHREAFQPFAPSIMIEHATDWFRTDGRDLPYMAIAARAHDVVAAADSAPGKSTMGTGVPACIHVDGTARIQTVDRRVNPEFHALLEEFLSLTGCPMLLNTSFNGRGEPIVCSPSDALRTFDALDLDALAIEGVLVTSARHSTEQ